MQSLPQDNPGGDPGAVSLADVEQRLLLDLARQAMVAAATGEAPAVVEGARLPRALLEPRACFVTLRRGDELRGCIGQLTAGEPLWEAVMKNAARAATCDRRFTRVTLAEAGALRVEISVLTSLVPLEFESPEELLGQLRPGIDGVVLRIGESVSTFLPQVWDDLKDKESFMEHLSRKGGHVAGAWRQPGSVVSVYRVEHFQDA
jgi:AmmeMemoRadiSam system protein A